MAQKLSAAQRRYIENALLIAALGLTFKKLEEDYETKLLGDIADTTSGGTPLRNISTYYGGDIPWIKSGELNDNVIESAEEFITEEGLANSSAKIYPKGTLVVALYGATVGKTGILGFDAASNQAVCAVFPKTQEVTNEFIFWFLRHKRPEFLGMSFGGAQPNISQKIIRETHIPIPSLELQKTLSAFFALVEKRQNGNTNQKYPTLPDEFSDVLRTVVLIESLAARVNEAQRLRGEADDLTKIYETVITKSILQVSTKSNGVADDTLSSLPNKWHWKRIGDFAFVTKLAGYEFTEHVEYSEFGDVPVIRAQNISKTGFKEGNYLYVKKELVELLKRSRLQGGEVLMVFVGAGIGNVGIAPKDKVFFLGPNVALIRVDENIISNQYLYMFLKSEVGKSHSRGFSKVTAQGSISMSNIRDINVPVPPLDEQRRIVAYLDGLQAKVNALRELQVKGGEELSALMASVLDKAFKGEL